MCLIPTVTKYRLVCSFEDSTTYPSPAPSPPNPNHQTLTATHFTFYSQQTLKSYTVKKTSCFSPFPCFVLHFFLFHSVLPFFLASFSVPSFRCIYFLPSHIVSFILSFWMNFIILLPSEEQYQEHKNSEHRNLFRHTS